MIASTPLRLLLATVLASTAILIASEGRAAAGAVEPDPGCQANTLPRNDDDYSAPIPIGFDMYFGGTFHSTLRINNNGYVSFGPKTPVWWQLRNWEAFDVPLIAAFHADVDTRALGTSPVTWGPITFGGHPALCVNWVNVGYYDTADDLLNSFQLILVSRSDLGAGGFDVYLNYDQIQWEAGSGDGAAPRVGIYDGSVVQKEVPGSGVHLVLLDGGDNSLSQNTHSSMIAGRFTYGGTNGLSGDPARISGTVSDTNGSPVAGAIVTACYSNSLCGGVALCKVVLPTAPGITKSTSTISHLRCSRAARSGT